MPRTTNDSLSRFRHGGVAVTILLLLTSSGCDSLLNRQVTLGRLTPSTSSAPSGGGPNASPPTSGAPPDASRGVANPAPDASVQPVDAAVLNLRDDAIAVFDFRAAGDPPYEDPHTGLTLSVPDGADPRLLTPQPLGLEFALGAILVSDAPATTLAERSMMTDELAVEIWVTPRGGQELRTRLVTMSASISVRNFAVGLGPQVTDPGEGACAEATLATLGQGSGTAAYFFRRRWALDDCGFCASNGFPELFTPKIAQDRLTHVVATRSADGTDRIFVDSALEAECNQPGDFQDWDVTLPLQIGDEHVGGDRRFTGTIHLVAIYDRALRSAEVVSLFAAGI